jgi:anti-sigma-K factor RskA
MTHSPLPENWQELMAGYALGDLSSEEAETLQRLLTENPELTSEVDQFQEVLALMPYALPDEPEPPPQLKETILSQAQGDRLAPHTLSERAARKSRSLAWQRAGGAIAALLLITLAVNNYQLRQTAKQNQVTIGRLQQEAKTNDALIAALRQPNAQVFALEGTQKTSGSLVFVPAQNRVTLVTDLPKLPTGKIYRLWAMPTNASQPTYCGEFGAEAIASWSLPETVCGQNGDRMLITTEVASDPPIPKGELVMKSKA